MLLKRYYAAKLDRFGVGDLANAPTASYLLMRGITMACSVTNPQVGHIGQYTDNSGINWNDFEITNVVSGTTVDGKYANYNQSAYNVPLKICLDDNSSDYHTWGCVGEACITGGGIRPR